MQEPSTPYTKLQPLRPTPRDEICQCQTIPIKLMCALTYNPIYCMNCNREMRPESLGLTSEQVEIIVNWRGVYNAIYLLWLDTQGYEQWAMGQLLDIRSEVNVRGRAVQRMLDPIRRCFYWYFQDQSVEGGQLVWDCPVCGDPLQDYTHGIFLQRICEKDSIVVAGE